MKRTRSRELSNSESSNDSESVDDPGNMSSARSAAAESGSVSESSEDQGIQDTNVVTSRSQLHFGHQTRKPSKNKRILQQYKKEC
jgi:hypothetical protein